MAIVRRLAARLAVAAAAAVATAWRPVSWAAAASADVGGAGGLSGGAGILPADAETSDSGRWPSSPSDGAGLCVRGLAGSGACARRGPDGYSVRFLAAGRGVLRLDGVWVSGKFIPFGRARLLRRPANEAEATGRAAGIGDAYRVDDAASAGHAYGADDAAGADDVAAASAAAAVEAPEALEVSAYLGKHRAPAAGRLAAERVAATLRMEVAPSPFDGSLLHATVRGAFLNGSRLSSVILSFEYLGSFETTLRHLPNLHLHNESLASEHFFRSPAALIASKDGIGAAILPDLDVFLDANGRIAGLPQALDLRDGPLRLLYGLAASKLEPHMFATATHEEAPAPPAATPPARLFRMQLLLQAAGGDGGGGGAALLGAVARYMWRRYGRRNLYKDVRPQVMPFEEYGRKYAYRGHLKLLTVRLKDGLRGIMNHGRGGINYDAWENDAMVALGMRHYADKWSDRELRRAAEGIWRFGLSAPVHRGASPALYSTKRGEWVPMVTTLGHESKKLICDVESYYSIPAMSTTMWYYMYSLDASEAQQDARHEAAVLDRLDSFVGLALRVQLPSGAIPHWIHKDTHRPCEQLNESAATALPAAVLAKAARLLPKRRAEALSAALRAASFLLREVLPRQRFFDFEVFFSCSPKALDWEDAIAGIVPQNTLSMQWTADFFLALHELTEERRWLEHGEYVLSMISMYHQVWSPPFFAQEAYMFGGFGVMNTDAEWSDGRSHRFVFTYVDYFLRTGTLEYLERAVAAARAGFTNMDIPENRRADVSHVNGPLEPENLEHFGDHDRGQWTGFTWGSGGALAATAYLERRVGSAWVDLRRRRALGIDAVQVHVLSNSASAAALSVRPALPMWRGRQHLLLRVAGQSARAAAASALGDRLRAGDAVASGDSLSAAAAAENIAAGTSGAGSVSLVANGAVLDVAAVAGGPGATAALAVGAVEDGPPGIGAGASGSALGGPRRTPVLLSDEDMQAFIAYGFLVLAPDVDDAVHQRVADTLARLRARERTGEARHEGNNVLPLTPEIAEVLQSPEVDGALTSVLGEDYAMHAHRHAHLNEWTSTAQKTHQDSFFGGQNFRPHQLRWAMALYYPQATTLEMGPTGIVPGSQYMSMEHRFRYSGEGEVENKTLLASLGTLRPLCVPRGAVVLMHYDLYHAAQRRLSRSAPPRWMLKFQFYRVSDPSPSWSHESRSWLPPRAPDQAPCGEGADGGRFPRWSAAEVSAREAVWRRVWRWALGPQVVELPSGAAANASSAAAIASSVVRANAKDASAAAAKSSLVAGTTTDAAAEVSSDIVDLLPGTFLVSSLGGNQVEGAAAAGWEVASEAGSAGREEGEDEEGAGAVAVGERRLAGADVAGDSRPQHMTPDANRWLEELLGDGGRDPTAESRLHAAAYALAEASEGREEEAEPSRRALLAALLLAPSNRQRRAAVHGIAAALSIGGGLGVRKLASALVEVLEGRWAERRWVRRATGRDERVRATGRDVFYAAAAALGAAGDLGPRAGAKAVEALAAILKSAGGEGAYARHSGAGGASIDGEFQECWASLKENRLCMGGPPPLRAAAAEALGNAWALRSAPKETLNALLGVLADAAAPRPPPNSLADFDDSRAAMAAARSLARVSRRSGAAVEVFRKGGALPLMVAAAQRLAQPEPLAGSRAAVRDFRRYALAEVLQVISWVADEQVLDAMRGWLQAWQPDHKLPSQVPVDGAEFRQLLLYRVCQHTSAGSPY